MKTEIKLEDSKVREDHYKRIQFVYCSFPQVYDTLHQFWPSIIIPELVHVFYIGVHAHHWGKPCRFSDLSKQNNMGLWQIYLSISENLSHPPTLCWLNHKLITYIEIDKFFCRLQCASSIQLIIKSYKWYLDTRSSIWYLMNFIKAKRKTRKKKSLQKVSWMELIDCSL